MLGMVPVNANYSYVYCHLNVASNVFYVLLAVHLRIILVINQLDAQVLVL